MKLSVLLSALVLSALFLAGAARGTAQEPDILIVDGKVEYLNTNPLADWLALNPKALPGSDEISSSNWRGYIATWEVAGGKLWLRRVDVMRAQGTVKRTVSVMTFDKNGKLVEGAPKEEEMTNYVRHDVRSEMFPNRGDVVADWYSGTLIVPKGEVVNYVHMGYGSTFERYTVIWVRRGEVTRQLDLRADQFMELRKQRFKAYQQTDEYKQQLAQTVKQFGGEKAKDVAQAEDFLFEFYAERYLSIDPDAGD